MASSISQIWITWAWLGREGGQTRKRAKADFWPSPHASFGACLFKSRRDRHLLIGFTIDRAIETGDDATGLATVVDLTRPDREEDLDLIG